MHNCLKCIGFKCCDSKEREEELIQSIIDYPMKELSIYTKKPETGIRKELTVEYAENIGITVVGVVGKDDKFHIGYYFPFFRSDVISTEEELYIAKKNESDAYTVLCDDSRVGVSLIYYLQNVVNYLEVADRNLTLKCPSKLAALAMEGTILLPTMRTIQNIEESKEECNKRAKILTAARQGDQSAIDTLALQDIDAYSSISKRIRSEDVFSIVDTCFAPYGMESEVYKIIGVILSVEEHTNRLSGEKLVTMQLYCNHMVFSVCMNQEDLQGEPAVGRRFRGVVWLQGSVNFPR